MPRKTRIDSGDNFEKEQRLSTQELTFVSLYIETGKTAEAVVKAGYKTTSPAAYGRKLLSKPKIQNELQLQLSALRNEYIADNVEIMQFFTKAMRGEVKDQFGLDATLADRMKAAEALAKRRIDMQAIADKAKENEVKVRIFFGDEDNDTTDTASNDTE